MQKMVKIGVNYSYKKVEDIDHIKMHVAAQKRKREKEKKLKFIEEQSKYQRERVQLAKIHEGLKHEKMQREMTGAPTNNLLNPDAFMSPKSPV